MAIEFTKATFSFNTEDAGPQRIEQVLTFPTNIRNAVALLRGFEIRFAGRDREFFREVISIKQRFFKRSVLIQVDLGLRDNSGIFDDPYNGVVDVAVIVDRV